MTPFWVIEVHAEGWPRYIGPFVSGVAAEDWMEGREFTGSWSAFPVAIPSLHEHLGRA